MVAAAGLQVGLQYLQRTDILRDHRRTLPKQHLAETLIVERKISGHAVEIVRAVWRFGRDGVEEIHLSLDGSPRLANPRPAGVDETGPEVIGCQRVFDVPDDIRILDVPRIQELSRDIALSSRAT